jgi:hypothetical protein
VPNLPTLAIDDQALFDRVVAAFEGEVDNNGNPLTPQQAYKRWLKGQLRERVTYKEANATRLASDQAIGAGLDAAT